MRLDVKVTVTTRNVLHVDVEREIKFARWRAGFPAGSPLKVWSVTPLEPATEFVPEEYSAPSTVKILVTAQGSKVWALKYGHLDEATDGINYTAGHTSEISGRNEAFRFMDQGPRRDTVFVPQSIIEETYPHGVKVRTLAGETVIGLPPDESPRIYGAYGKNTYRSNSLRGLNAYFPGGGPSPGAGTGGGGVVSTGIGGGYGSGHIGIGTGGPTFQTGYRMVTEVEYVEQAQGTGAEDDCVEDNRYGTTEDWVNTVPPIIVLLGGTSGFVKIGGGVSGSSEGGIRTGNTGNSFGGGASINNLIGILAKAAGFADVVINTPDMGLREPFTVNAGSTWYAAILTLVGPWNPMVFIYDNILHVIDIEGVTLVKPAMTVGPESASVISRRVSRVPPYRNVDIIGTLRRTVRKPAPGGAQINRQSDYGTPHAGDFQQAPYNLTIVDSVSSQPTADNSGAVDSVTWLTATGIKKYHINPDLGQSILLYSEDSIFGSNGPISKRSMAMDYHSFDEGPHAMLEQQSGILRLPAPPLNYPGDTPRGPSESYGLLQQTYTIFDDNTEIEGASDSHSFTDGVVVVTYGPRGEYYKAVAYGDAAAGDTTDLSPGSLDIGIWAKISERHVTNHVYDQNVGHRRTVEIDSIGNRPPRFKDDIFMRRHQGDYSPRQRYCFPVNKEDGVGTKSLYALFVGTRAEAELIRDRAMRRGNKRHVELTVKLTSFVPGLIQGMVIKLNATPLESLAGDVAWGMEHANVVSGNFFLAGFEYEQTTDGDGRGVLCTYLYLRSQF